MRSVAFIVPGQPVAKGRPRLTTINGKARSFTPAKTVAYEGLVAHEGTLAMAGAPLLDGPVAIDVVATFQAPKRLLTKKLRAELIAGVIPHISRPDSDNILKAVSDGLNGVVYIDDGQICRAAISKRYGEMPGVAVTVREL